MEPADDWAGLSALETTREGGEASGSERHEIPFHTLTGTESQDNTKPCTFPLELINASLNEAENPSLSSY